MIKIGPNQQPRWFTSTLRHNVKCVRTLKKKYLRSLTENNKTRLQTAEKNLSNEFLQAKSTYESTLIHNFGSSNDSKIYQYITNITNSHLIPLTVHLDSSSAQDDFSKATLFNHYFHSVFTTSKLDLPDYSYHWLLRRQSPGLCIYIRRWSAWGTKLSWSLSTGIDGIGPKV